ncbi:DNA-binding MarR family transcriptional regulator [Ruegeria sp. P4]|nr:transcriptional regulator, MarR family [Ruegeria sp. TrichCH4B]PXW79613.1 DNA-binding MarR family transcriptional regulator [Ruegeria sp. P4]
MTSDMSRQETVQRAKQLFGPEDHKVGYNRLWFNIMRAHRKFYPVMAKVMRREGLKDPIWYEILLAVENAGPTGKPMQQLEETLFVPQYALSRHIGRMQKEGLLRREYVSDGKRKQILFLTPEGEGLHERVWPIYMDTIQEVIGPTMDEDEAYEIAYLLIKMLP